MSCDPDSKHSKLARTKDRGDSHELGKSTIFESDDKADCMSFHYLTDCGLQERAIIIKNYFEGFQLSSLWCRFPSSCFDIRRV